MKTGSNKFAWAALPVLLLMMVATPLRADSFTEPFTVFYGKVLARDGAHLQLLDEGNLEWHIRCSNGSNLIIRTELFRLNNGNYSYRLEVPHQAISLGLTQDPDFPAVALQFTNETHSHVVMTVDGHLARPVGPASVAFEAGQKERASVYRLDLEIDSDIVDTDGDGIPDWWEDLYGLDKQDPADALGDLDGDGVSNLGEYAGGFDPSRDNREPQLETSHLVAYAEGFTAFVLSAADSDSTPAQLLYTITTIPSRGELFLRNTTRNPVEPDTRLALGDQFTQEDVENGRVVFVYDDASDEPLVMGISLADENAAHAVVAVDLPVYIYRPGKSLVDSGKNKGLSDLAGGAPVVDESASAEEQRLRNYLLSSLADYVIRDGSGSSRDLVVGAPSSAAGSDYATGYVTNFGPDQGHVLIGGFGNDHLLGSMESDVLLGGEGTNVLRGNGGADWFVFVETGHGSELIEDFNIADLDVIDLSRLVVGTNQYVSDYLLLETFEASAPVLRVDQDGSGSGYTNLSIVIEGLANADAVLSQLVDDGRIVVAGRKARPQISAALLAGPARENGPTAGQFIFTRSGDASGSITVPLTIGGSAINGLDYSTIPSSITFTAGVRQLIVQVNPFADSEIEVTETIQVILNPGSTYTLGILDRASMSLEDLRMMVTAEALEPVAVQETLSSGMFLITRDGVINQSVLVRFTLGGTATAGTDYQSLSAFVNFVPYQTTALIEVKPLAGGSIQGNYETVVMTISTNVAYLRGSPYVATVSLVAKDKTFAKWRAEKFPDFQGSMSDFASADPDGSGIANLLRYAFGMDPENPDASLMPRFTIENGRFVLTYRRNTDARDIEYRVLATTGMPDWDSSTNSLEDVTGVETASDSDVKIKARKRADIERFQILTIEVLQK